METLVLDDTVIVIQADKPVVSVRDLFPDEDALEADVLATTTIGADALQQVYGPRDSF